LEQLRHLFQGVCDNWLGGLLIGLFAYLVQPSAAFYALWIAVALDFMTKLVELSYGCGGYLKAIQTQRINSKTMFQKAFVKIIAYFVLTVVAYQSKFITTLEAVPILFSTIIYSILFLVEVHSIIENMIGAGCDDLRPLLMRFEKEKERAINGTGNLISDVITNHSESATEQTATAHQNVDEGRKSL
jgi:phage-related holin